MKIERPLLPPIRTVVADRICPMNEDGKAHAHPLDVERRKALDSNAFVRRKRPVATGAHRCPHAVPPDIGRNCGGLKGH